MLKTKTSDSTRTRIKGGLSQFTQSDKDHFGFSDVSSVDAATAINYVNTSSSVRYFQTVVNSMLSPLNRLSSDNTVCKCISIPCYGRLGGQLPWLIFIATVPSNAMVTAPSVML